ncbi:MAG: hypothetical protein ACI4TP_05665 [Anaerotignum sp.]
MLETDTRRPVCGTKTGLSCAQEIGSVFVFYAFGGEDAPCCGGEGIFHVIIIQIFIE